MDVVGYAIIKKNPESGFSNIPIEQFTKHRVRVIEFAQDGGVLVVDSKAEGMAFFEKPDVLTSFECGHVGEVVTPPNLDFVNGAAYASSCLTRKGGYNNIVKELVIAASLHRGEFCDSLLWAKQ